TDSRLFCVSRVFIEVLIIGGGGKMVRGDGGGMSMAESSLLVSQVHCPSGHR
ncbi:hypothetical protein NDU88_005227, partial [Pleurodeles waltl]